MAVARITSSRSWSEVEKAAWRVADGRWAVRLHVEFVPTLPVRCPLCRALADVAGDGRELKCAAGCATLALPGNEPDAGWELARAEKAPIEVLRDWSHDTFHDVAWDRYSSPTSPIVERFGASPERRRDEDTGRWDWQEVDGGEPHSVEGAYLARVHAENPRRIGEINDALAAFGEAVRKDKNVILRGGRPTATRALDALMASEAGAREGIPQAEAVRAAALRMFWSDGHARSMFIREVGKALAIELNNAVQRRGGQVKTVTEVVRHSSALERTTPFAGFGHAIAWLCGDHGTTTLGWGSAFAGLGGAEAKFKTSRGVQFGQMSVAAAARGEARARNEGALLLTRDVEAAAAAARVDGAWQPRSDDPKRPRAARCLDGRPLEPWELRLVQLCDHGTIVEALGEDGKQRDWRKLTPVEAIERVRAEALKHADDPRWGRARHLTPKDGRQALREARQALREAFAAWGLIPPQQPRAEEEARAPREKAEERAPVDLVLPRRGRGNLWTK